MKKQLFSGRLLAGILFLLLSGRSYSQKTAWPVTLEAENYRVQIDPATSALCIKTATGQEAYASRPGARLPVKNQVATDKMLRWDYPDKGIKMTVEVKADYLDVDISTDQVGSFTWPSLSDDVQSYMIPWHDGKFVPAKDPTWIKFCKQSGEIVGLQDLSMQFLGINYPGFALLFIIKNPYNNNLQWTGSNVLGLNFTHEFPATVDNKRYGFRIYVRKNNPVVLAKTYKDYLLSEGRFVTLEQKAERNPDIRKLYGAPFIYIWGNVFVVKENITDWNHFLSYFASEASGPAETISKRILMLNKGSDSYNELVKTCKEFPVSGGLSMYSKNLFTAAVNLAMESPDFFQKGLWKESDLDDSVKALLAKGSAHLSRLELYRLNQKLFYQAYKDYLQPITEWGNGTSLFTLRKLQEMNIKSAWLGLESFTPAFMHPEFLQEANRMGYLIGPYDSYHSIHAPGKEQWETAKFADTTLYESATVLNKDGTVNKGFQGIGRKLNPTLSLPAVKERVGDILSNGFAFNSWFIDCDATGEVFDDYSKNHVTNMAQDVQARLERMAWIRDSNHMVIGSEGGNDFAASTIAFGHGLCSPGFPWDDLDWRKNKQSKYYFGPYFSPDAGLPIAFSKQVPIKELYHYIYYDCRFNLPLFQLVYNNSVIVTHHWGMGSLKLVDEVKNNKLREILYNFPPLYNLDRNELLKREKTIADHLRVFAVTHARAIRAEMTDFEYLSQDKTVQRTRFGNALEVIANFGDKASQQGKDIIPAMSLLIIYPDENKKEIYTPIQ